jgi:hypothetical protein
MASTATASAIPNPVAAEGGLSLVRLYVMRAIYLAIGVLEGSQVIPGLFSHVATARGVIPALLSGLCLLCLVGLRYPRQMLPLLLFEMAWKYVWFFAFGLPQYMSGHVPATWAEDFKAITVGVAIMPLVIPWSYVWRNYVLARGDRWR